MFDNREFDVSDIFWGVLPIVGGGKLMTIEDLLLSACGYQLLPITTSQLMGDSREFDALHICWGFLLIVDGGELITI